MAISSYGAATDSSGVVRILKDLDINVSGRDVLVVEDIIDSGLTLSYLMRNLRARKPASLEVVTLLTKPERREIDVPVRYVGFEIPNRFVIGYGLDFAERYRNLPYVAVLHADLIPPRALSSCRTPRNPRNQVITGEGDRRLGAEEGRCYPPTTDRESLLPQRTFPAHHHRRARLSGESDAAARALRAAEGHVLAADRKGEGRARSTTSSSTRRGSRSPRTSSRAARSRSTTRRRSPRRSSRTCSSARTSSSTRRARARRRGGRSSSASSRS